ncbi:MAG: hypothetical protein JWL76_651 [Thermoleophilia bacterium]|nr:hypothetical protein [Thermoleophilia bacterium]
MTITTPPLPMHGSTPRRRRVDPPTVAWPIGLVLLLVALGTWRVVDEPRERAAPPEDVKVAPRSFGDARLDVPRSWQTLGRAPDRITWGAANRAHTVTLASTEASSVALPTIVREVVAQSVESLPGASVASDPVDIELGERAPRADSAVLVRFEVGDGTHAPIHVVQVWRRDARAGVDLVATWTSADGTWPASPREHLPQATTNG